MGYSCQTTPRVTEQNTTKSELRCEIYCLLNGIDYIYILSVRSTLRTLFLQAFWSVWLSCHSFTSPIHYIGLVRHHLIRPLYHVLLSLPGIHYILQYTIYPKWALQLQWVGGLFPSWMYAFSKVIVRLTQPTLMVHDWQAYTNTDMVSPYTLWTRAAGFGFHMWPFILLHLTVEKIKTIPSIVRSVHHPVSPTVRIPPLWSYLHYS